MKWSAAGNDDDDEICYVCQWCVLILFDTHTTYYNNNNYKLLKWTAGVDKSLILHTRSKYSNNNNSLNIYFKTTNKQTKLNGICVTDSIILYICIC